MLKPIFSFAILLLCARFAFAATVRAPNVEVKYEGIDEKQATAIARTISAARKIYVDDLGFDMPEMIVVAVTARAGLPTRLYNDGLDRLTLSISNSASLD